MAANLEDLIAANQRLLDTLVEQDVVVATREQRARRVVEFCEVERRTIERDRTTLMNADIIYRRCLAAGAPDSDADGQSLPATERGDDGEGRTKSRARVGAQRYRMLCALRAGPLALDELVDASGLSAKRVKHQMTADVAARFVIGEGGGYSLSPEGDDLLQRFEKYKRDRGEVLPSLTEPIAEDDSADDSGEESLTDPESEEVGG
jgi:hypothetical protein